MPIVAKRDEVLRVTIFERWKGEEMSSLQDLAEQLRSPEFNTRALALAELVRRGKAATPVLLEALNSPDDVLRVQAARGLGDIADPASAEALAGALDDRNEEVRAHAAQGLALVKDERAIAALVRTINDLPNLEHHPYTLSIYNLIELGSPALPAIAPLLKSSDPTTRERAFLVFRTIISSLPEGKDWQQLWQSLGSYDPHDPSPERERAADKLIGWIKQRT
jgi:HEAT repeat protein